MSGMYGRDGGYGGGTGRAYGGAVPMVGYRGSGDGGYGGDRGGGRGDSGDTVVQEEADIKEEEIEEEVAEEAAEMVIGPAQTLVYARRSECNKCSAPSPAGANDHDGYDKGGSDRSSGRGDEGGSKNDGGNSRGGSYDGSRGGGSYDNRSDGSRSGSYGGNQGRDNNRVGYGQAPPPVPAPASYGGPTSYPPNNYGTDAVPPPTSYSGGGPTSYPSYGGGTPSGYGGGGMSDTRSDGRGGPPSGGYGTGVPRHQGGGDSGSPAKIKQCDDSCGDNCDNSRIYISNLPPDVTTDELRDLFSGIGQVTFFKYSPEPKYALDCAYQFTSL